MHTRAHTYTHAHTPVQTNAYKYRPHIIRSFHYCRKPIHVGSATDSSGYVGVVSGGGGRAEIIGANGFFVTFFPFKFDL